MGKLTGLERILTAVKHQEPDVVPAVESPAPNIREALLPGSSYEDFVEYMDLDWVGISDRKQTWSYKDLGTSKTGRPLKQCQWGATVQFTGPDTGIPMEPGIKSEKELDSYVPPDPDLSWRYEPLRKLVKRFKGQRAIVAGCTDPFALARENLFGVAYFAAMIKRPDIVDRIREIAVNYQLRYVKNSLEAGADIIFVNGDWAMTKAPMVSREFIKKFIAPDLQRIIELTHSYGKICFKHSDGNIWPIFDVIIDAGADGVHPIDPMAGMDIGEAKTKFGDKITLMGNVSCAFVLVTGSVEEVRQETKEVIRKAGKGGGLICMSSNSIHSGVKPENYVAMVKAIREYGKYPLTFASKGE